MHLVGDLFNCTMMQGLTNVKLIVMLCFLLFRSVLLPYILILSQHFCCYVLVLDIIA